MQHTAIMADSSSPSPEIFVLYRYTPSVVAAAIVGAVFVGLGLYHSYLLYRYRTWFFVPFVIGLLRMCLYLLSLVSVGRLMTDTPSVEAGGYFARIFSHYDTLALGPYIVQTMLILVAPPLFAASIYMTLGRLIVKLRAESLSLIPVKYLTKVFVVGDVISFLLQCGGGGYMAAGTLEAMDNGETIVIVGLAVQLLFFGFFVIVSAIFHYRVKTAPGQNLQDTPQVRQWEAMMYCLYGACILIFVRSVFRVIEFVQGNSGYLMSTEWLLYVFDAVLMALQAALLLVAYPGKVLGTTNAYEGGLPLGSRGSESPSWEAVPPRGGKRLCRS
ncbi:RTA1 domain-containing protein [Aspergillus undulatus]|uniref:RTA1 domain-containing protein n=1 Tax=Aspergillus undulatus TaxID=1810928 RepID=UPI003CCE52F1